MNRPKRTALFCALTAAALALTGCAASSTPYQPLASQNRISGGYSDERLSEVQFRVSFAGNTLTSREKVETYLLFRAAELTLEQGYDWFAIEDRLLEHDVEQQVSRDPLSDPIYGSYSSDWRPYWRYYGPDGWRGWHRHRADVFWRDHLDVREVERYEAIAEIRLGDGETPNSGMRAFNAAEVIERIGPQVEYPEQQ